MTLTLMRSSSETNKVTKSTTTVMSVSGVFREASSVIDPVFRVEATTDLSTINYLYIPDFSRYYFVRNITAVSNNIWELSCHVDVLMSFADEIRDNKGIVKRSADNWNLYLNDGSLRSYQNPLVQTKEFPNGFTTKEFVLAIAGS